MMGKFDVLEPCGALKTKGPPARVHAVWRAVELRQKNHDQSLYPSGRIKGKRLVIRDSTVEEDADR
jgi:hypothetical protein